MEPLRDSMSADSGSSVPVRKPSRRNRSVNLAVQIEILLARRLRLEGLHQFLMHLLGSLAFDGREGK